MDYESEGKTRNKTKAVANTDVTLNQETVAPSEPATPAPEVAPGPLIYIGPNLRSGQLSAFAVYRGGIPAHVQRLVDADSSLGLLIVPVKEMAAAQQRAATPGTIEYRAVQKLKGGA